MSDLALAGIAFGGLVLYWLGAATTWEAGHKRWRWIWTSKEIDFWWTCASIFWPIVDMICLWIWAIKHGHRLPQAIASLPEYRENRQIAKAQDQRHQLDEAKRTARERDAYIKQLEEEVGISA